MTNRHDFIVDLIQKAGKVLLGSQKKHFSVSSKGGDYRNLVTSVDIEVNDFITEAISSTYPDEKIYSEESVVKVTEAESYWALDPIDGTSNFARQTPHFAVVISYIENGEPIVGAIYNPVTRELWSFEKGQGAFLNGVLIHVAPSSILKDAYVLLHIGRSESVWDWGLGLQKEFLAKAKKNINLGSSALDLAFLASGRVDAVIYGMITTIDVAVAVALVREAGGEVYDIHGIPITLSRVPQQIIATSTRELFEEISKLS